MKVGITVLQQTDNNCKDTVGVEAGTLICQMGPIIEDKYYNSL